MSDLVQYQQGSVADYQDAAVRRLGQWATAADAAYKVAERLVQTSFCPAAFKGKPIEATAAMLAGMECGLSPMSALRAFDVIQGQAAPRAITLRAIVQSFGHEVELTESTVARCRMRGRRRGSESWQSVTWTMDRARELGLAGKDGWKKQPTAMLIARATSEICRLIAADAILGIGYSFEEISDGAGPATVEVAAPEPARTVSWSPDPETEPEPPADNPEPPAPDAEPTITAPQMKALHAALADADLADRDKGLAYMSEVVGEPVESSKDLTKAQASKVIDALKAGGDDGWLA